MCVKWHHGHWKRRCVVLHDPEAHRKVLKYDAVAIIEESSKGEVEGLRMHIEVNGINVNKASEEWMLSWVRSVIIFKNRYSKNKNQDVRNMLMAKEN